MSLTFMNRLRAVSAVSVLALGCVLPMAAQSAGSGAISGTLTDKAGALIPGATVVITDTDTGAVRTVTSNGAGFFIAPFLQSGHYEVVAGGGSFARVDRKDIIVTVGDTIAVNTVLPPSSVSVEVVVNGSDEPVLDTAKTSNSQVVDQAVISNLPVNGRRFDNFVLLTPNVVPDGSSGILSFRGIYGLFNQNLVDGTNNNQAFFSEARGRASGAPYVYSIDSIKEFSASVSGYSAEFGASAGGIINAITKSGGNQLHGDLFYYLRYPALNALDPYAKYTGRINNQPFLLTPTIHQQQQFGGSVGGAIIKDKLFYFFTYDGYRKVNPILYTSSIPAATILAYATPAASATCPAGVTQAQCLAAAQYIVGNLTASPRNLKQDIFFPKLDYQFNQKNHIAAQFLWDDFHQPNGYNSSATVNNSSVTQNGTANFHERIFIGSWDSVLGANKANSLRGQWSRDLETDTTNSPGPATSLSGLFAYGETSALPRPKFPDEHRIEAFDVFTLTRGKHTPKFGVDLNFIHEQLQKLFQGDGSYSYSGATAAANFGSWVQDVYGLNGAKHYSSFTQVTDAINKTAPGLDDFWNKNLGGFVEDSWRITHNLTLNAGLRYDVQLVPQPPHPYQVSYNNVPSPLGNFYTNTIHINYKMYSPRFGFAWNPQVGTVVRGSYGMFYGLNSNSLYYTTRVENGVYQQQYNITSPTAANAIAAPNVLFTPPGPALAAPFAGAATPGVVSGGGLLPLSFRGISPNFTNPYTHSFDLAVEQQLPFKSTLTLAYVGTRGMRLPYDIDINQPHATTVRTYAILNAAGALDTTQGKAGFVTVPFTPVNTLRPSPNDGNVLVGFSGINSWYHSGAFTLRKPFDHGLELLVNYTWAKAMDESQVAGGNSVQNGGGGTFQGTNIILDPFNLKGQYGNGINLTREYGRSDLDVRGRLVATFVYTSTFHASFLPKYATYAINGWELSGTYTAQSGQPLTSLMSGTLGSIYQGLDGGATGLAVTLNNSAGAGRVPFIYRNNQVYKGIHNLDVRAGRSVTLHKDIKMDFYAEAFNVVNHEEVAGVSAIAYQYQNPVAGTTCPTGTYAAPCIVPYTSTKFGTPTATTGTLFGARQLQFIAKLHF
jgi:hypothetical protein